MENLYKKPLAGSFTKFCAGNQGNSDDDPDSCVSIAPVEGGGHALRDTKHGGKAVELRFTDSELDQFALGWAEKRGLI